MLFNFLMMCLSVLWLPSRNPRLAAGLRFGTGVAARWFIGGVGALLLTTLLAVHVWKDLSSDMAVWYFHSTWLWIGTMVLASAVFATHWRKLRRSGVDLESRFAELPLE